MGELNKKLVVLIVLLSYNIKVINSRIKFLTSMAFIFLSVFFIPQTSIAELEVPIQESEILVETYPENPEPYQDISIKLTSYSIDLNKAKIEWQNAGKIILSGIGKTSYSFKALGPNSAVILTVNITPFGSYTKVTKQIVVKVSEIDVLWESVDGYTPPFYKGKSFVSPEGLIKVVAIPNTSTIKSGKGNIVYKWAVEDNNVSNAGGYNKDAYIFTNNALKNKEEVTVSASSVDNQYSSKKTISIPITPAKIIFYKKSPTDGVLYNQALIDNTFIEEEELIVVAEPYFLALKNNENLFDYKWKINGNDIDTPSKKTELTIRPADRGGFATISVVMENLNTFLQKVTGQLKITL